MSIARLFVRTFFVKVLIAALGVFITIVSTRYLLRPEARAIYNNITINAAMYGTILGGFGVFQNRAINRLELPAQKTYAIISLFWTICTIVTLLICLLIVPTGWFTANFTHITWLFVLLGAPLVLSYGLSSRLLWALNRIDQLNITNIVQAGSLAVMLAVVVVQWPHETLHRRVVLICIAWLVSQLVSALVGQWAVKRGNGISLRPKWYGDMGKEFLRFGSMIAFANIIERFNYRADYYLVVALLPLHQQGLYTLAITASEMMSLLTSPFSTIVYTRLASADPGVAYRATERTFRIMFIGTVVTAILASIMYPIAVHLVLPHTYLQTVTPFRILVIGMVFLGPAELLFNYFTSQIGSPRISIVLELSAAAINIAIGWSLVHRYQIVGAAIGSSISYFLLWVITVYLYGRLGRKGHLLRFTIEDFRAVMPRRT